MNLGLLPFFLSTSIIFFVFFSSQILVVVALSSRDLLPRVDNVSDREIGDFVNEQLWPEELKTWPASMRINYQGHTTARDPKDEAPERLFQFVDGQIPILNKDTTKKLIVLFDNYDPEKGVPERETAIEKEEIEAFLDAILATSHFQKLKAFLKEKRHPFAQTDRIFRGWMKQLWFDLYSREGDNRPADSSGFEHVFVGEFSGPKVNGLHNWIRVYGLERNQSEHFDYRGFVVKRANVIGAFKFTWRDEVKPLGSFLLGTSPEFELALDTLCFLLRRGANGCRVEVDGCPVTISTFDLIWRGKAYIGTAFPSPGKMTSACGKGAAGGKKAERLENKSRGKAPSDDNDDDEGNVEGSEDQSERRRKLKKKH